MADRTIFISHARDQTGVAQRIAGDLRGKGLTVWLDSELQQGVDWVEATRNGLSQASDAVLLIGEHTGGAQHAELAQVLQRSWEDDGFGVVPVVIGDAEVPAFLRTKQFLRARAAEEIDPAEILESLGSPLRTDPQAMEQEVVRRKERLSEIGRYAEELSARENG